MLNVVNKTAKFISRYLAFFSVAIAVSGMLVPQMWVALAGTVRIDLSWIPFLGEYYPAISLVNLLLMVIMFSMGVTLKGSDFTLILKRPKDVLIGITSQFVCSASLGWLVAQVVTLTGVGTPEVAAQIAVGIVLLGCVPGGTASNVMAFLAKGDVPLSVTITLCTTLTAPILTPTFTLLLAGQWIEVNFWQMFFSILVVVFFPIVSGLGVRALVGDKVDEFSSVSVLVSSVSILAVMGMCVGPNKGSLTDNGLAVVVVTALAVLVHHVLGLLSGYSIGTFFKFSEEKRRTLTLEVALQNSALACTLAATGFPGSMAILPCVLATVIHQVVGPMVAGYFRSRDTE